VKKTLENALNNQISDAANRSNSVERTSPSQLPPRLRSTSLTRQFKQLDKRTRQAINESFLLNIHQGKSTITVSEALKEFGGKNQE
jgi:hypothetical protein